MDEQKTEQIPATKILVCKCGWYGKPEDQDALGSKCGCCPDCGNEHLIWLSDLQKRIKKIEVKLRDAIEQIQLISVKPCETSRIHKGNAIFLIKQALKGGD